jgi:cyclopropane-fatty-acyl-phospholipid synthase|tara:strand:- start:7192 stop:8382 length:1191 start_codon:yes stop_codon:yes gene_type:complete
MKMFSSIYKNFLLKFLGNVKEGTIIFKDKNEQIFGKGKPVVNIEVLNSKFYRRAVLSGDLGFAESYAKGEWKTNNLTNLILILINNKDNLGNLNMRWSFLSKIIARLGHWRRKNTISGSKRNIQDHYDLSNDLFSIFLDKTMTYSCGVFESEKSTLHESQIRKIDMIIEKAQLKPDDHVLEIGSGWGGLSRRAVEKIGCKFTTITLSEDQYTYVKNMIKEGGLEDNIEVKLIDYRNIEGTYDKVISVEMIEAIGYELFNSYFEKIEGVMKPNGIAVIQAITYPDKNYDIYRKGCDFIQKFIFPGSLLPSVKVMNESITQKTDMKVIDLERIGPSYATTLNMWSEKFNDNKENIIELGFDEYFINLWNYYFSYCEAGFRAGTIDDVQMVITGGKANA